MDERTIGSERREVLGEATMLLDPAISRQAGGARDREWMIEQARRFIDAGAYMIMIESEGITENADPWRTDVPAEVINSLGLEKVNFESAVTEGLCLVRQELWARGEPLRGPLPDRAARDPLARHLGHQEPLGPCPHLQGIASWRFE
jgi:(2R)-phospho-3-sulfolactate synthase (ComA)